MMRAWLKKAIYSIFHLIKKNIYPKSIVYIQCPDLVNVAGLDPLSLPNPPESL